MSTAPLANPSTFTMTSSETLPLGFDFTNYLGGGESLSACTITVTDISTNTDVSATVLSGAVSLAGAVATQTFTALTAGHRYRAVALGTIGTREEAVVLILDCPY